MRGHARDESFQRLQLKLLRVPSVAKPVSVAVPLSRVALGLVLLDKRDHGHMRLFVRGDFMAKSASRPQPARSITEVHARALQATRAVVCRWAGGARDVASLATTPHHDIVTTTPTLTAPNTAAAAVIHLAKPATGMPGSRKGED